MASTQPTSAVVAPYRLTRISARAGLRNASCSPHSSADEGTSSRFIESFLVVGRLSAGLVGGLQQDLVQGHASSPARPDRRHVMLTRVPGHVPSVLGNGAAEVLQGDRFGMRAAALAGVEGVDGGELVGGEVEVEDVDVLRDPGRVG